MAVAAPFFSNCINNWEIRKSAFTLERAGNSNLFCQSFVHTTLSDSKVRICNPAMRSMNENSGVLSGENAWIVSSEFSGLDAEQSHWWWQEDGNWILSHSWDPPKVFLLAKQWASWRHTGPTNGEHTNSNTIKKNSPNILLCTAVSPTSRSSSWPGGWVKLKLVLCW